MEFTINTRENSIINFTNDLTRSINEINSKNNKESKYTNTLGIFSKKFLSKGVEGSVYKSFFKDPHSFFDPIAIKISTTKNDKNLKKLSQKQIYKLFYTNKAFHTRNFIELLSQTLTNQLVLQNICPNFLLNFYWEYDTSHLNLITYNEFANFSDFESWCKIKHSDIYWFNALFQIMIGLIAIKKFFGMLHTDLHIKNILVHKVKPGGYWTYIINNVKYHVPNLGYIFFIHDFGYAYIKKKLYIDWHYKDT